MAQKKPKFDATAVPEQSPTELLSTGWRTVGIELAELLARRLANGLTDDDADRLDKYMRLLIAANRQIKRDEDPSSDEDQLNSILENLPLEILQDAIRKRQ